jgi:hypothetical protein
MVYILRDIDIAYYIRALREQNAIIIFSLLLKKVNSMYSPDAINRFNLSKYWHNMKN